MAMIKTFKEAVKFLERYIPTPDKKHPGEFGLKRMERLVELLGNPQFAYPTIHVGGTSGKGSTSTIIATILAQKYKVGLHTSPHLVKITERIRTYSRPPLAEIARGGLIKDISVNDFIDLLNEVYPAIKKIEESKLGNPSYFEIVTAMAFLYFKKQKVDIAVIEVGMGGRYDATNVIKSDVAVITNVGLDHTEILGDTVEKIAEDKAGIIKQGVKVVTAVKQPSVIKIIENTCKDKDASLSLVSRPPLAISARGGLIKYEAKKIDENGCIFDYIGEKAYRDLRISLLGRHQVENAAIAIRVVEILRAPLAISARGALIKEKEIRLGLERAYIPGRLEIISKKPLVILDGAHNPEKMKALVAAIKKIFPKKKVKAIIAIKSGKDAKGILKEILPICHEVIFTKFRLTTDLGDTFSYTPAELQEINSRGGLIKIDPIEAIKEAMKNTDSDSLILITGSLYLIGEVKRKIRNSKHEILNKFK